MSLLENLSQHLPQTLQAMLSYPLAQCIPQCQKSSVKICVSVSTATTQSLGFIAIVCTKVKFFFHYESVLFLTQFILKK